MSDDFSTHQRSWIGLIIVLCIAVLLCLFVFALLARGQRQILQEQVASAASTPEGAIPAPAPPQAPPESSENHFSTRLPSSYTSLIRYPVVFEYATAEPQLSAFQPLQAIVATYCPDLSDPVNIWCSETLALESLQTLAEQYSVDDEHIYLVTAGLSGLDFATRHASHFCGVILQLPEDLPPEHSWQTLPLANLNHLPVLLDTSRNPHPDPNVKALTDALTAATGRHPLVPQHLLKPCEPLLPQLLARLTLDIPQRFDHLTWQTNHLATGEAWWMRAEGIATPGKPASFEAVYHPGPAAALAQITITTQNLNAFALRRTWKDFEKVRTFILTVDGQRVDLVLHPNTPEWCIVWRHENGWQTTPPPHDRPRKTATCSGPLIRAIQAPHIIVWGSADPDTAPLWEKSANALAQHWETLTRQPSMVLSDQAFVSQNITGKHLILLGGPRENLVTNGLLDTHPDFLRQIYQKDPQASRKFDPNDEIPLCCLALYPADFYVPGKLALVVLADSPEFIENAWQPLFSPQALQGDFLLFQPGESTPRATGWCTPDWEVEE